MSTTAVVPSETPSPQPVLTETRASMIEHVLHWHRDPHIRLTAALISEAGLSYEQICRLTPTCFNFASETIVIKDENKEFVGYADFNVETLIAFFDWMRQRSEFLDDGLYGVLLNDVYGEPKTPGELQDEFERALRMSSGALDSLRIEGPRPEQA